MLPSSDKVVCISQYSPSLWARSVVPCALTKRRADTNNHPVFREAVAVTNYAIVGVGILGASVARALLMHERDSTVTILEKEFAPAQHQTGHNSGVVYAGLYYLPGSLKARMCRRGVELIREYTAANDLPYEQCGKILVATTAEEETRLHRIYETAMANSVPGSVCLIRSRSRRWSRTLRVD